MRSFEEYRSLINSHLTDLLPDLPDESKVLREAMAYSLEVGGKRLRPVLLLAACEFAGGDTEEALPYALALEYIHTYSLIHDDLPAMDNDDLRRGRPTNHKVYGEAMAILAGDGLLSSAAETVTGEPLKYRDDPEAMYCHARAAHEIMSRAGASGMIAGQTADVTGENKRATAELVKYIEELLHSNESVFDRRELDQPVIHQLDGFARKREPVLRPYQHMEDGFITIESQYRCSHVEIYSKLHRHLMDVLTLTFVLLPHMFQIGTCDKH